jgi:glutathione S-transferase
LAATATTTEKPVLTLYRDTNGWCPFCERVWIALEKKGIPYDEKLVDLQNKPQWYKDIVPTTLVPAIEWHDESWDAEKPGSGKLVWESKDVLEAIDEKFATMPLRSADEEVAEVVEVLGASVGFVYGANATEDQEEDSRTRFSAALDALDAVLASSGGPFVRGSELSAADLALAPTLERFSIQLKVIKPEFPALDAGRPAMQRWYKAMDAEPAYTRRVKGDVYSWTAATASFLRIFSSNASDAETQAKIKKADAAAAALLDESRKDVKALDDRAACAEAVAALSKNRKNVARDASDVSPKTQPHVQRCATVEAADAAIDAALVVLNGDKAHISGDSKVAAAAIAARLCAPRDMGAPAAAALRHTLLVLAEGN